MLDELAKQGVSGAPTWLELLFTGIGISAAAFWARIQLRKGKAEAAQPPQAELAMVALDSEAMKMNAAAVEALVVEMRELRSLVREGLDRWERVQDKAALDAAKLEGYQQGLAAPRPRRRSTRKPRAT